MRVRSLCDGCGWRGTVVTGWVPVDAAIVRELPPERVRRRGAGWYYRRRLRDMACPGCATRNLHAGRAPDRPFTTAAAAMGAAPLPRVR